MSTRIDSLIKFLTMPLANQRASANKSLYVEPKREVASSVAGVLDSIAPLVSQMTIAWDDKIDINRTGRPIVDFQESVEELLERVNNDELGSIRRGNFRSNHTHELRHWEGYRTLQLALMYSQAEPNDYSKFQDKVQKVTLHDVHPQKTRDEKMHSFEEVLFIWRKLYDFYAGYGHLALASRKDGIEKYSMFERFIRDINSEANYKAYHPAMNGGGIKDFPGPGFTINGVHKKINRHLEHTLPEWSDEYAPMQKIDWNYRRLRVDGQESLKNSRFFFYRGIQGVINHEMKIDEKTYGLVIFNDHLCNPTGRMAYLIPEEKINQFLDGELGPVKALNEDNIFYPEKIEEMFGDEIIKISGISTISGMHKALPVGSTLYPNMHFTNKVGHTGPQPSFGFENEYRGRETTDVGGKIHVTHMFGGYWDTMRDQAPNNFLNFEHIHNEVRNATMFGLAQLDLIYDGYRNYSQGFSFNEMDKNWDYDPMRLLRQAIRWHYSPDPDSESPDPYGLTKPILSKEQKPLLVPVKRFEYSQLSPERLNADPNPMYFDPDYFPVGFIDTASMVFYRRNTGGDAILPNVIPPSEEFDEETTNLFRELLIRANSSNSDLVFVQGDQAKNIVFSMMKGEY